MAVESLMLDSEGEEACCEGKLSEGDTNVFASLLHVADHCLYKIVRWARNLPHFGNVSVSLTDVGMQSYVYISKGVQFCNVF